MRISRVLNLLKILVETKNIRNAWLLSFYGKLPLDDIISYRNKIILRDIPDIDLSAKKYHYILRSLPLLKDLRKVKIVLKKEADGLILTDGIVQIPAQNWEEIFIAHEIFYNQEYNFDVGEPINVIDIGGNIGIASLYFASQKKVSQVKAFELFPDTSQRFKATMAMNPHLSSKIILHEYGLGDSSEDLELEYHAEVKGSVGLFGVASHALEESQRASSVKRKVRVERAVEVFENLLAEKPSRPVVVKIDCEGAEYQIINCLASADILSRVEGFLIEWHVKGPDAIVAQLINAGHYVWLRAHPGDNHGMIYSCLRKK